ncbi:MAG: TonB-dependent receptor [Bacteroidales bacterium]|jgi:TonB-linked SusC/RagA family outer membrane protein
MDKQRLHNLREEVSQLKRGGLIVVLFVAMQVFSMALTKVSASELNDIQQMTEKLNGKVLDTQGVPIIGASVVIKDKTTRKILGGTMTDANGNYVINKVVAKGSIIEISFIGFVTVNKTVGDDLVMNAVLIEDSQTLEGVEVVAFGTQKKESVIGAVSTIAPGQLKVSSSNLTLSLAGKLSGVISYQRSGEPGSDDAAFFIRGITTFGSNTKPLILIDGIELSTTDLARLQPDDIERFSIMKDATATALYGARGANGVILVTTKQGQKGVARFSVRIENSYSSPTQSVDLADPITYMRKHNEAIRTRDNLAPLIYSDEKIDNTVLGSGSYIFPATDWSKELMKKGTTNQRVNMSVSGGGDVAQYYVAASFNNDNGNLRVDKNNNFNNNINQKAYTLRSNVNIDVTKTTKLMTRISGTFDDYTGPIYSGTSVYNMITQSNPVLFPAVYPDSASPFYVTHTMFGNALDGDYLNPYAEMVKGYRESSRANISAQLELKQDLRFITKGLDIRVLYSTGRIASHSLVRAYKPFYYKMTDYNLADKTYSIAAINKLAGPSGGDENLSYEPGSKSIVANTYLEGAVNYARTFGSHSVSGLLVYQQRNNFQPNAETLLGSLPYRNVGLSGRATYGYQSRYFFEFNFGYNGSERFDKKHRFGFFPSAGLAWMISNEKFFKPMKELISTLKFRASYGIVGNDAIGSRFLYMSDINMDNASYRGVFGINNQYILNGISVNRYGDPTITWEKAYKTNFALELSIKEKLNVIAEYYTEYRTNILQDRKSIPSSMGLWEIPQANVGEAKGHGVDISTDYSVVFPNKSWLQFRGNFTYATNKYVKLEEYDYPEGSYKSKVGYPISVKWGLIAERLFIDDNEVSNSPKQYGDYSAGDIKYRDIDGNGIINDEDYVPIGYPQTPEIIYGFGASYGYKGFDISVFFQGLANESFYLSYNAMNPFINNVDNATFPGKRGTNAMLKAISDSHWSEDNRDLYAMWPRLSTYNVSNNNRSSTWFMRDGSFLRLKSAEFGYTIPQRVTTRIGVQNLRIYLSGTNLLCFSKFKEWDVEMGSNGLGYPIQRIYNIGINVTF